MFIPLPCLSRDYKMDCTGFAPISADKVLEICTAARDYIQQMQEKNTAKYIERRRKKTNKDRRFWARLPWVSYKEATTDDIKAELDCILKHGSIFDVCSVFNHYPLDDTSQTWKDKAEKLIRLAEHTKKAVYVNGDDWEVILRFSGKDKDNATREKENNASNR